MTRVNLGINPQDLSGPHLLSEHREMVRIPNAVRKGRAKIANIPENFTLGSGHVKFFYTRLGYLFKRYRAVYKECLRRGYNITDMSSAWNGIPDELMGSYKALPRDTIILRERLRERDPEFYDKPLKTWNP